MSEELGRVQREVLEGMGRRMTEKRNKDYKEAGLCPKCGADIKNWKEVFGEEHKCEGIRK